MKISLIAAISKNMAIGIKGHLPWHIPEDLAWFKKCTLDKPIVMGRKTYESIGHFLPNRINVILSRDPHYKASNCIVLDNIDSIMGLFKNFPEIMIIGGEAIYKEFLPHAHRLYLTVIDQEFKGDVFFPKFDESSWKITSQSEHTTEQESLNYKHIIYEKK